MRRLAHKLGDLWRGGHAAEPRVTEPEPVYSCPRPMTGFFAHLTPEQQARALAYRGPEGHGDRAFLRKIA